MSAAQSAKARYFRYPGPRGLLSSLPQFVVRELERKLILFSYSAGAVLFRQGETAEGIFFLFEGRVKMSAIAIDTKTALLKIAGPGEILGLAAVMSEIPHLTTAQTTVPSSVGLLREEDLASCMKKYAELSEAAARSLAMEYKEIAMDMLLLRVPCSSSQRLAAVLVRLGAGRGTTLSRQLALTYTHADLGQLIGASRETVTRLMKKLERQGVIKTKHSTFQVTDLEGLKEIARLS